MNLTLKLQIFLKRKYDAKNEKPYNITLSKILNDIFLMKNRLIRNDNIEIISKQREIVIGISRPEDNYTDN